MYPCLYICVYTCIFLSIWLSGDDKANTSKRYKLAHLEKVHTEVPLRECFPRNSMSLRSLNKLKFLLIASNYCMSIPC